MELAVLGVRGHAPSQAGDRLARIEWRGQTESDRRRAEWARGCAATAPGVRRATRADTRKLRTTQAHIHVDSTAECESTARQVRSP